MASEKHTCIIDNKKLGGLTGNGNIELSDNTFVCRECWEKVYGNVSPKKIDHPSSTEFKKLLEIEKNKTDGTAKPANFAADITSKFIDLDTYHKLIKLKKGLLNTVVIPVTDITNYDVFEDGETVTSGHGVSRAIVGSVFSPIGALVGAATGKKHSKKTIDSITLTVTTAKNGNYKFALLDHKKTKLTSKLYLTAKEELTETEGVLKKALELANQIISGASGQAEQTSSNDMEEKLRSLKGLLDDGIITQDEFDAKKKQLLGI